MSQTTDRTTDSNDGRYSTDRNIHHSPQQRNDRYASRWDDLPNRQYPRNRVASSSKPSTVSPANVGRISHHHRWKERKTHGNNELWEQYRSLQVSCRNELLPVLSTVSSLQENETKALYELLHFMKKNSATLPAEETSIVVVHDILLPVLQLLFSPFASMEESLQPPPSPPHNEPIIPDILNVIQTLLSSNPHASAMLSPITLTPITEHVGNETFSSRDTCQGNRPKTNDDPMLHRNPTRKKLWSVLQQCLPMTVECFTLCVQVTKRLDQDHLTSSCGGTTKMYRHTHINDINHVHLDLPRLIQYLRDAFTSITESGHDAATTAFHASPEQGLNLLLVFLQYPPTNKVISSSVSFIQSVLFPHYIMSPVAHPPTVMDCTHCGWHPSPTQSSFLSLLHDGGHHTSAMQCATQLLQSMPWSLWLGNNKKSQRISTFQQNLIDVLNDLIRVALCHVTQQKLLRSNHRTTNNSHATELAAYIKAILTHVPFDDSNTFNGPTRIGSETIAVTLVDVIMSQTLVSIDHNVYAPMIQECVRGHITSSGPLQRTSLPLETWLQRHGRMFVNDVLSRAVLTVPSSGLLSILYDLLRSYPDLILKFVPATTSSLDQQEIYTSLWPQYENCLQQHILTEPEMVAQCIERLLLGRQNCMKDDVAIQSTEYVSFDRMLDVTLPIFELYIIEQNVPVSDHVQGLACSSISHFLTEDWNLIAQLATAPGTLDRILILIEKIIDNCSNLSDGEALQITCCKAIGNTSTTIIPSCLMVIDKYQTAHALVKKFFLVLQQILTDEYAIATRCMAMFALGNLAHTIVITPEMFNSLFSQGDLDLFLELTDVCLRGASDRNEKLATNAVRTTAYMIGLVLQCQDQHCYCNEIRTKLLQRVITLYIGNIRTCIAVESSIETNQSKQYSWKRRLAIRKQGWGSCNSLSFLLERNMLAHFNVTDDGMITKELVGNDAVSCFVESFENINTVHEKVVLSACAALRSIPDLSAFVSDMLFSRAMVACCIFLFGDESTEFCHGPARKKLKVEIELVLDTILSHCTETSIMEAVQVESFVSNIHQLFQWMVHRGCFPQTFEKFATAFSLSGSVTDVHIEQQFINHSRSYESTIQSDLLDEL